MARRGRPASDTCQPVRYSSSHLASVSGEAVGLEDEADCLPIFSLSKSSTDVVTATGPPRERDPAWTRMDLRRSYSTNTHSEHQKLQHHMWLHIHSQQLPLPVQSVDGHTPPAHGEHWLAGRQRWSQRSGSTNSRSSTPDTIVWRDWTSCASPGTECPLSKPASSPTSTSPFISPLQTLTSPSGDLLGPSSFTDLNMHQQMDLSSPTTSPPLCPPQSPASSPIPSHSPNLLQLSSPEEDVFLENNLLFFTFPSQQQPPVSLAGGSGSSGPGCHGDDVVDGQPSTSDTHLSEDGGVGNLMQSLSYLMMNSQIKTEDFGASACNPEVPAGRGWRSLLASSMSDSRLGECCKCNLKTRQELLQMPKGRASKDEGSMTTQVEVVDAAVQTISPTSSSWVLTRNMSSSNMGSHSILGSPPGSRLNLKSSMGSHSNLVSPSFSMFPASSVEEEARPGDDPTSSSSLYPSSSHDMERRRACLKIQGEEIDVMARRGSMKQVQWGENGMMWDIHRVSPDQEVLSAAIRRYLEVHNSPPPARRTSKKKKAPKPPLISNVVKAMAPELHAPVTIPIPTCMVEAKNEDTPREDGDKGGGKKEETVETAHRNSKAEEEVKKDQGTRTPKSPSRGGGANKKSMIRSLKRPGWCGGSRKADD